MTLAWCLPFHHVERLLVDLQEEASDYIAKGYNAAENPTWFLLLDLRREERAALITHLKTVHIDDPTFESMQ